MSTPNVASDGERVKAFAAAVGRIPSGLFVVTARNGSAETGMLASWVQQCSFEPLQVSVAVKPARPLLAWLTPGSPFTVNVLEQGQTDILVHFGKGFRLDEPAFTGLDLERPGGAAPVLPDVLAYLDCRVEARYPAGDHDLLIGRVVGGRVLCEGQPMVHIRKNGSHY
jgi:flavin reductase (DIM6/NTAB) family NADH-FMN oxidoreductase RutF